MIFFIIFRFKWIPYDHNDDHLLDYWNQFKSKYNKEYHDNEEL